MKLGIHLFSIKVLMVMCSVKWNGVILDYFVHMNAELRAFGKGQATTEQSTVEVPESSG